MPARGVEERAAFADAITLIGALIGVAIGLFVLFGSRDPAMAFHGLLFVVAGALAAIFVLKISFQTPTPSETHEDYMDGPIKVATIAAVFWGIAGFIVGDVIAWQLAFPALNLDLPWTSFGRSAAAAHVGRDLRLRRQCAARHLLLRRAAHVPRATSRPLGALVRDLGLPALHRRRRHRLPARHHAGQGVRRARVVRRPAVDQSCGCRSV